MRCTITFVGSTCVCENYLPLKHFEHRLFVWGELREMGMCTISAQPRHRARARPPSSLTPRIHSDIFSSLPLLPLPFLSRDTGPKRVLPSPHNATPDPLRQFINYFLLH